MHVDAVVVLFQDPGSTPGASTKLRSEQRSGRSRAPSANAPVPDYALARHDRLPLRLHPRQRTRSLPALHRLDARLGVSPAQAQRRRLHTHGDVPSVAYRDGRCLPLPSDSEPTREDPGGHRRHRCQGGKWNGETAGGTMAASRSRRTFLSIAALALGLLCLATEGHHSDAGEQAEDVRENADDTGWCRARPARDGGPGNG